MLKKVNIFNKGIKEQRIIYLFSFAKLSFLNRKNLYIKR